MLKNEAQIKFYSYGKSSAKNAYCKIVSSSNLKIQIVKYFISSVLKYNDFYFNALRTVPV